MSQRETFLISKAGPSINPGVSPNQYRDRVNVEIRVGYPPYPENHAQIRQMLDEAYAEAVAKLPESSGCGDWPAPCNCDDPITHNGH